MSALKFPATIYQTKHQFNDYSSDDMQCGDLTEKQLRSNFDLDKISDIVDPRTGEEVSMFSSFRKSQPKSKTKIAELLLTSFFGFPCLHIT